VQPVYLLTNGVSVVGVGGGHLYEVLPAGRNLCSVLFMFDKVQTTGRPGEDAMVEWRHVGRVQLIEG